MHAFFFVHFFSAALAAGLLLARRCRRTKTQQPTHPAERPYEWRYPLDTGDLSDTPDNLAARQVEDTTPQGPVRMTYSLTDNAFEYWADNGAVPYRFLETVARKWVIVFNQRHLYANRYRLVLQNKQKDDANRYLWRGRFSPPEFIPPPAPCKPLSYRDFKEKKID
jgi:hypothetical protein